MNHCLEEKRNIYILGKKGKANLVTPIEKKINRYAIDWSKEKKHCKLLLSYKYKKCSILNRAK